MVRWFTKSNQNAVAAIHLQWITTNTGVAILDPCQKGVVVRICHLGGPLSKLNGMAVSWLTRIAEGRYEVRVAEGDNNRSFVLGIHNLTVEQDVSFRKGSIIERTK